MMASKLSNKKKKIINKRKILKKRIQTKNLKISRPNKIIIQNLILIAFNVKLEFIEWITLVRNILQTKIERVKTK